MIIVTASRGFMDIDAYAGCIAYSELLNILGQESIAVTSSTLNASVSETVRSWPVPLLFHYNSSRDDTFIIVDSSDPRYFDDCVDNERISEIFDHRPGFESYWEDKLGENAHIEKVGAACTMIYEKWKTAGCVDLMSKTSARLLMCGILDNTLNFGSKGAIKRDRDAYQALAGIADLSADWPRHYFSEIEEAFHTSFLKELYNDSKGVEYSTIGTGQIMVSQMLLWDARAVLANNTENVSIFFKDHPTGYINAISLSEGVSYFTARDADTKADLSPLLSIEFTADVARAERMWLRKEILAEDIKASEALKSD